MKNKSIIRIWVSFLLGISLCLNSVGMVFAEEADIEEQEDTIDLAAFRTDDEYCYEGIPWLSTLEEVEEVLGKPIEVVEGQGNINAGTLRSDGWWLMGEPVRVNMGFLEGGLTDIGFAIGADPFQADQYEGDLTEYSEKLLEQLTELYGEWNVEDETKDSYGDTFMKTYQWNETKDGKINTALNVQCMYAPTGTRMCSLVIGAAGVEATKGLREKIEHSEKAK